MPVQILSSKCRCVRPALDILEKPEGVQVFINLPGVTRENLSVEATQIELVIKGMCHCGGDSPDTPMHHTGETMVALEFSDMEFGVCLALHPSLDPDTIKASLKNGVLSLFLPNRAQSKPRQIKVDVAG